MYKIIPTEAENFLRTELGKKIITDMATQGLEVSHFLFFIKIYKQLEKRQMSSKEIAALANIAPGNATRYYLTPLERCDYVARTSRYSWCLTSRYKEL